MSEETKNTPQPYEPARAFPPCVYEVAFPEEDGTERVARVTAAQLSTYAYEAIDDRFIGEPWFETSLDGMGVNGPAGLRANRERLKVVIERLENCAGLEGADCSDKAKIAAYLDAPGNEDLAYAGWIGYTKNTRARRVLVRPFRDPGEGTSGSAREDSGHTDAAGTAA